MFQLLLFYFAKTVSMLNYTLKTHAVFWTNKAVTSAGSVENSKVVKDGKLKSLHKGHFFLCFQVKDVSSS